jgi:DNA-binding transcriptional regulator YdaS (Cro superfamily)
LLATSIVACAKHFFMYGGGMKKHMTLDQWCEQDGRGPSAQAKALGISRATLWRLRGGDHPILPDTAKRIELATGGKVKAATLLGLNA